MSALAAYDGDLLSVAKLLPNADPWWKSRVRQAIEVLIESGEEFTSDDVFGDRFGIEQPSSRAEKNHVGSIFAHLSLSGRVREVRRIRSTRPEANGRKIIVWIGVPK